MIGGWDGIKAGEEEWRGARQRAPAAGARNAIFTAELVSFYSLLALKSSSVGQRRMAFIISGSAGSVKVSEENKQTASAASCEEGTVIRIGNRLQAGERYSKKGCGNLPSRILFHSALFHQGAIQLDILVGGAAPAEIGAQAAIHKTGQSVLFA